MQQRLGKRPVLGETRPSERLRNSTTLQIGTVTGCALRSLQFLAAHRLFWRVKSSLRLLRTAH